MTIKCSIHMKVSEKLTLVAGRDGGLQNMEIVGMIMLRITDPEMAKIRVALNNNEQRSVQFQVCVCVCVHAYLCVSVLPFRKWFCICLLQRVCMSVCV